ncbi:MAG: acetyl-CoA carboxylase biotin carboxylase subunit family protein [Pseudonocardiaceae bacterium]
MTSTPAKAPLVMVLSGRRTVDKLKAAGYRVGLVANSIPLDLALLVDLPIEADLDDWAQVSAQVQRAHRYNPVAAVVTQLENLLPLAGRLRDLLGLSTGVTEQAVRNCADKATTNRLLARAGIGVARSRVVDSPESAVAAARELGLPVIVKPRNASSAAGLMCCERLDMAGEAVRDILAAGWQSALVEEFLDGAEIVLFAYRSRGATSVISTLDAQVGPPPKFVKLGGCHPSRVAAGRLDELSALTDRALAAVGLDNWVATVQVMLTADGPKVIEINPRVPGGQTVSLIAETTGYEPTLVAVEAALGRLPQPGPVRASVGWYRGITFDTAGSLSYRPEAQHAVPGLESRVAPLIDIDVRPGEQVLPRNHPRGGVFGRIVLCGQDEAQLERDYQRVLAALELRLEPVPEAGDEASWRPHSRCC